MATLDVSIHAPAWGASCRFGRDNFKNVSFNPRTRVGCDMTEDSLGRIRGCFNPRTRVGCDMRLRVCSFWLVMFQSTHPRGVRRERKARKAHRCMVSIHAPAWGATLSRLRRRSFRTSFNPRTRVGCDDSPDFSFLRDIGFNPRTRVGCDRGKDASSRHGIDVSIHAPAWGATLVLHVVNPLLLAFQSTHPRGVRLTGHVPAIQDVTVSIHAPAWGAT